MDPPSIAAIPQELMDQVLHYLPDCMDRLHLSVTCRSLRAKSLGCVFENISMLWKGNMATMPYGGNVATVEKQENTKTIQSPRIDLLLRTLIENPEIAASIKNVELQGTGFCHFYREGWWFKPTLCAAPNMDSFGSLKSFVLKKSLSNPGTWESAIRNGDLDAFIALFLGHCPNLHSLTLGIDLLRAAHFLPRLLSGVISVSRGDMMFPHLKYLELGKRLNDSERVALCDTPILTPSLDWRSYLAFLYCPHLERVVMNLHQPLLLKSLNDLQHMPGLASLTVLQLRESSVEPLELGRILEWTSGLVRLEYDYIFPSYFDRDCELDCVKLDQALKHVKRTLQYFQIHCRPWDGEHDPMWLHRISNEFVESRLSFKDFPVLNTLHISPCVLFGWEWDQAPMLHDTLPQSLRKLCFHADFSLFDTYQWRNSDLHQHLAKGFEIENWRSNVPWLGRLNIIRRGPWDKFQEPTAIEDLCQRNDLVCQCVSATWKEWPLTEACPKVIDRELEQLILE